MSIHPSLRGVDTLTGDRSVFTRVERVQQLIKEGKLDPEGKPYGLPKVRTTFKIKAAKKKADEDDAPETEAAAE
ncbi:MAG: small basic protein (TIGR04137 family) [Planctomycetota bacterium]|jgi:small basic protein (TIGR04137 family)